eukprot:GHVT01099319.1.p1 GENE.GHVT01099319.1~~GHVT01099319.1.p1  ORF type:complete len:167 (+),score=21.50 GHVT01099319.1:153-653(+)
MIRVAVGFADYKHEGRRNAGPRCSLSTSRRRGAVEDVLRLPAPTRATHRSTHPPIQARAGVLKRKEALGQVEGAARSNKAKRGRGERADSHSCDVSLPNHLLACKEANEVNRLKLPRGPWESATSKCTPANACRPKTTPARWQTPAPQTSNASAAHPIILASSSSL